MTKSMTAFARIAGHADWGAAVWELRSVNHRYLELTIKLPENLRELEEKLRAKVRQSLGRGKVECVLRFQSGTTTQPKLTVNEPLLKQLLQVSDSVRSMMSESQPPQVMRLLSWSGVLQSESTNLEVVGEVLLALFDKALLDFISAREREGALLNEFIEEKLSEIDALVVQITKRIPSVLTMQREKILERFNAVKLELDPERLEQEMLIFTQKVDVTEELERLRAHAKEVRHVLKSKEAIGRRLDFLMQEMNRESNTLASKSCDHEVTMVAVDLKVLVEQIREQVQNIE